MTVQGCRLRQGACRGQGRTHSPGAQSLYQSQVKPNAHGQSCPTLCDPMDCSLPGSSVHGILQATTLEWVAISFSRGSSQPGDQTRVSLHCRQMLYPLSHQGKGYKHKDQINCHS